MCLTNIFLPSSFDWPHISNSSVMTSAISEGSIVPEHIGEESQTVLITSQTDSLYLIYSVYLKRGGYCSLDSTLAWGRSHHSPDPSLSYILKAHLSFSSGDPLAVMSVAIMNSWRGNMSSHQPPSLSLP